MLSGSEGCLCKGFRPGRLGAALSDSGTRENLFGRIGPAFLGSGGCLFLSGRMGPELVGSVGSLCDGEFLLRV